MQTLPVNIMENKGYPGVEFVVLDYNSKDNIGDWVQKTLGKYIRTGLLKYYKTSEPQYFHSSHAKNMALKLGTGEIICMVDADNYAGPGYAQWIDAVFKDHGDNTIITTLRKDAIPYRDQGGKFCLSRDLFYAVGGLDEDLVGYGMEDTDLINRMENAGGKRVYIEDSKYLQFIKHSNEERIKHFHFTNNLDRFCQRIPQPESDFVQLLYFFKDNSFYEVRYKFHPQLQNNQVRSFFGWLIDENGVRKGVSRRADNTLSLAYAGGQVDRYQEQPDGMLCAMTGQERLIWKEVTPEDDLYHTYKMAYTECLNRRRFADNDRNINRVNPDGWGKGRVNRNFDDADSLNLL
jgi:hypothetical protein